MVQRSVRLLFCASVLLGSVATGAWASGGAALAADDLKNAQVVGAWLKANRGSAPREQANQFLALGERARRAGRWGAASKSFGESALLFPSPEALMAYGHALLHERAATRAAASAPADRQHADWQEIGALYSTALAADDQLHTLKPALRAALAADAGCLAKAAQGAADATNCAALRQYQAALRAPAARPSK
ncbi:hypothetical protein HLB44_20765 [Aquincola sp. S2]|uniref:Tetratricopeptide repeat protein n=1 Tax=Pseudaquabacterium terrae TaxID=2732868 RepID=A0ABX2ELB4_9BURK|nr:hypothetical protein [Aquabacterium terrae]NRF69437.1 hypothetical protein [Aquabacterium terrae]